MTQVCGTHGHRLLDAVSDFRDAAGSDGVWNALHTHMRGFGIGGLIYGIELLPTAHSPNKLLLRDSLPSGYIAEKSRYRLYDHDAWVCMARTQTSAVLWSDPSIFSSMDSQARRSFEIDAAYGVTTGVTIPFRFAHGMGGSGVGCHAAGMTDAEFEGLWQRNGATITAVAAAFDVCMRREHAGALFPLSERERECLLWLAAGLRPPRIADRLNTAPKTVEKQIASARRKLKAATTVQAVTTALIFGLIAP